jgi:hypothetical protein
MSKTIMPSIVRLATGILFLGTAVHLRAQGGEEYYINGIFNPVIADVEKIDLRPQTIDTVLPARNITYEMLGVRGEVPVRVDSIEAAKLNIQLAQQKLYKGFVKAGFGLFTTPLAEIHYDQTRSRTNGYGIHFKHMSSNGGLDDVGPSDYSFNAADAFYSAYLKHHEVSGRFMYDRRRVSYYGYPSTDSLENLILIAPQPPDDYRKQVYNDIGFAARVKSLFRDSTKLAHNVGLEAHNYTNLTGSREMNLKLDAELGLRQGAETYGGNILIDNNAYRADLGDAGDLRQNGTLIGLSPHVMTSGDKYQVRVGAGIFIDALGKTTFHFYPQAYAHYRLFDDILVPYVGVDGRRQRNSFRSLTRENPWLGGAPILANSSLMYDIYGGLRGSFSSDIGFDVRISQSRTKGRPLFVSSPVTLMNVRYGDQFAVAYDEVGQLDISGEIRYSHQEHVNVYGRVDIFTYSTESEAEAWNLPPYQLGLGAVYDFQDKLLIKVEAQFLGARPAAQRTYYNALDAEVFTTTTVDLKGYMDLHLGLEYRYTKRLSVFLDASNLSASKYERWMNYPVQRGLILGGATCAF